jgi:hypothetical protein
VHGIDGADNGEIFEEMLLVNILGEITDVQRSAGRWGYNGGTWGTWGSRGRVMQPSFVLCFDGLPLLPPCSS